MELCETLGYPSVRALLAELTSEDISEWVAYYQVKREKEAEAREEAERKAEAKRLADKGANG